MNKKYIAEIVKIVLLIMALTLTINIGNNLQASSQNSKLSAEEKEERSNNYLESLSVEGYELSTEFNKYTQTYYVTIPADINSLTINAKTESEKATYRVTGNTNLKNESTIKVVVTSQNRLTKTYNIIVIKQADNGLKLDSLDIGGVTFHQEFSSLRFFYTAETKQSTDETELNINAVCNSPDTNIEIIGNKVVAGNNLITIILTSGNKTTTYQIELDVTVEKTITTEIKNNSFITKARDYITEFFKDENKVLALFISVAIILFLLIIIMIIKLIKKKKASKNRDNIKNRLK